MPATRLFIGGLDPHFPDSELQKQLTNFCALQSLDVKEQKDIITGEVVKRFAFATINGSAEIIDQCIKHLNGKSLNGLTIKVEIAKESFIERIKHEREARAHALLKNGTTNDQSVGRISIDVTSGKHVNQEASHHLIKKVIPDNEPGSEFLFISDEESETCFDQKHRTTKENQDKLDKISLPLISSARRPHLITRYDPSKTGTSSTSLPLLGNNSSIQPDLSFSGASVNFSLLDILQQTQPVAVTAAAQEKHVKKEQPASRPLPSHVRLLTHQSQASQQTRSRPPSPKKLTSLKNTKEFFVDENSSEVEENLNWLYTAMPESRLAQFKEDRIEIMKLVADRSRSAMGKQRFESVHTGGGRAKLFSGTKKGAGRTRTRERDGARPSVAARRRIDVN